METDKDLSGAAGIPTNAVSIYGGGDAMEDFPVLKAFQQYIEAEQNRSRKRIAGLSIFFGLLVAALIAVFVTLILAVENRNQTLNDRILELAMRGNGSGAVVVQPQQDGSALVQLTTKMEALQKQLADQQVESLRQQAQTAKEAAEAARQLAVEQIKNGPKAQASDGARDRKVDDEIAKIRRAHELLAAEKAKLAAERERLHQEEVERQRRRLYPEYYARKEAGEAAAKEESRKPAVTKPVVTKKAAPKKVVAKKTQPARRQPVKVVEPEPEPEEVKLAAPISYFEEEDEPDKVSTVSVQTEGGTATTWQIPEE